MNDDSRIRVGAVRYLNTKPLVYRFAELAPGTRLLFDLPSRLADSLAAGRLDVALIPSVEFLGEDGYGIVSDACIACRGPVLSVKLFFRRRPEEVRTLALDEGSRTSVALACILLAERFGVRPEKAPLPIGCGLNDSDADAVLLIGDRAIHSPLGPFVEVWDLGDQWRRWTGLPFVFAMWAARRGAELGNLPVALGLMRDRGVERLTDIATEEAAALGLTQPECEAYLRHNLHFRLGEEERRGLDLFAEKAWAHGWLGADKNLQPLAAAADSS